MDRFNYLYLAAMSLPSETEAQKVLKSMYMTKSKELFGYDRKSRDLKFNPTRTCRRCNSLWADGGCRITLKERPKGKCKSQRKCRQLVRKHYKYGMQSGRFTRMANFFARKMCRQVTFHCTLCDCKQIFYLRPKLRTRTGNKSKSGTADGLDSTAGGKKRKKKKPKLFAGLDRRAMTSLPQHKGAVKSNKDDKLSNKKSASVAKVTKVQPTSNRSSSKKLSKSGMLQLAQMLKNKDSSSSVNKLEMMFKK